MLTRLLLTGCFSIIIGLLLLCCLCCSIAGSPHVAVDEDEDEDEDDDHLILMRRQAVRAVVGVRRGSVIELEKPAGGRTDSGLAGKCRRKILDLSAVNFHNPPSSMPTAAWWRPSSAGWEDQSVTVEDILE